MSMLIALKRLLHRPAFFVLLLLMLLCVLLCGGLKAADGLPRCGVAGGGSDGDAAALRDALVSDGFSLCADEDDLREKLADGSLSMGVVLPDDLSARLAARDTDGILLFLDTPTSVLQPLCHLRVTARLCEVYAPYLTRALLADAGVDASVDEVRDAVTAYLDNDRPFKFRFESVDGVPLEADSLALRAVGGCLCLFLFLLFGFFACPIPRDDLNRISARIGGRRAFSSLALPGILCVLLFGVGTTVLALSLCDAVFGIGALSLLPAAVSYCLFLSGFGILLSALLGGSERAALPMLVLMLLSVAFCPIFADLPALLGLSGVRFILPTAFFYAEAAGSATGFAAAAAVFAAALPVLYTRMRICSKKTGSAY